MSTPAPAPALRRRLGRMLTRYGTNLTYTRGASSFAFIARASVMSPTVRSTWFTFAETDAWSRRPAYVVAIAGDFAPFGGDIVNGTDSITINNVAYLVRKHDRVRLSNLVIRTVLYCAA